MAESELSVLTRQSLDRRIASPSEVEQESTAWTNDRNERQIGVD
jgi:hypothetical protein